MRKVSKTDPSRVHLRLHLLYLLNECILLFLQLLDSHLELLFRGLQLRYLNFLVPLAAFDYLDIRVLQALQVSRFKF